MTPRHWAVFGATGGLGRALARELARHGAELMLFGRDETRLAELRRDLEARHNADVDIEPFDAGDPSSLQRALDRIHDRVGRDLGLLWAVGTMDDEAELARDPDAVRAHLTVNLHAPMELIDRLLARRSRFDVLHLVVLGSVAGDRVRGSRLHYGTAKAGLAAYLAGLRHGYARSRHPRVTVTSVKPGPTRTPMTAGMAQLPLLAEPDEQARFIVNGIRRGRAVIYAPPVWRVIMLAIRHLPAPLFHRMMGK